jgi:thioredoxin 1
MLPKLKTAIENKTEWTLLKVNVDENSDIANEYGVKSIPTFVIYKNGKFVETKVGSLSEEALEKLLD